MFIKKDRNKSLKISAPKEKTLYGVHIRKLPIAKYINFLRAAEELPQLLIGKIFPDSSIGGIIEYLKSLDKDKVFDLLTRLLAVVPEELMGLLSELLDIPKERLTEDTPSSLSLAELLEIISEFWELNDMSGFFVTARRLAGKMKAATTGSNVG
ncbi:MAG: hypothetical protein K2J79_03370 [Ruminiclostridium sp.]|nr:hypothetical protein [Ruminiclostridium sp.]